MDIKQKTAEIYDKIASGYSAGHFAHFWIEEFNFYKSIIEEQLNNRPRKGLQFRIPYEIIKQHINQNGALNS